MTSAVAGAAAEPLAQPASKVVITGSGFSTDEREVIRAWAQRLNAEYSGDLVCRKTTHLVSKDLLKQYASAKYYKALEWGIAIVSYRWLWDSMNAGRVLPLTAYKSDRPGPADAALRDAVTRIRKQQQVAAAAAAAAVPARGGRQPLQLLSVNDAGGRAAVTAQAGSSEDVLRAASGKPKSEKRPRELQHPPAIGVGPDEFTFDVPLLAGGGMPAPSPKLCLAALPQFGSGAAGEQRQEHTERTEGGDADGLQEGGEEIICETQAQPCSPSASACKRPPAAAACGDDQVGDQHQAPQPPAVASSSPSLEVGLSALGGTETISIAGGACSGAGDGGGEDNRTPTSGVSLDEPYVTRRGGGGQGASSHAPPMRPRRLQQRLDDVSACSDSCRVGGGGGGGGDGGRGDVAADDAGCEEASGEVSTPVGRPGGRGGGKGGHQHHSEAGADVVDLLTPTGVTPRAALGSVADGGVLLPPGMVAHGGAAVGAGAAAPAAPYAAASTAASEGSAGAAAAAVLYSGFDPPLAAVATVRKRLVRNDQRPGSAQQEQAQQRQQPQVLVRSGAREDAALEDALEGELEDSDVESPPQAPVLQDAAQAEALEDELEDRELEESDALPPPDPPQPPQSQRRRLRQGPGASASGGCVPAGVGTGARGPETLEAAVRRGPALLAAAAAPPPRPSLANSSVSVGSLRSMWQQRQEESRAAGAAGQSRRALTSAPTHMAQQQHEPEQQQQQQQRVLQEPATATAWHGVRIKPDPGAPAGDEGLPLGPPVDLAAPPLPAILLGPHIKTEPGAGAGAGAGVGVGAGAPGAARPRASERRRAAALATSSLVLEPESLAARAGHSHGAGADEAAAKASRRHRRAAVAAAFQATPTLADIGMGPDDDGAGDTDGACGYESAADLDAALAESQSHGDTGGAVSNTATGAAAAAGSGAYGGEEVSTPPAPEAGAGVAVDEEVPGFAAAGRGLLGPQAGPTTINRMLTLRTGGLTPLPAAQRRPLMPRTDWSESESDSEAGQEDYAAAAAAPTAATTARRKPGKAAAVAAAAAAAAAPPTAQRARKGAKAAAAAAAAARAYGDSDATVSEEDEGAEAQAESTDDDARDHDYRPAAAPAGSKPARAAGRAAGGAAARASIATAASSALLPSQTSRSQMLSYATTAYGDAAEGGGGSDADGAGGGAAFAPPPLTDDRSISRYLRRAARMADAYLRSLQPAAAAGAGGGAAALLRDGDVRVVKGLSRPPRSHTVRERHPGVTVKAVEFAEQVMLEPLRLLLNCRDRSRRARCPILALAAPAQPQQSATQQQGEQQQEAGAEEVFLAEPCVVYRLPSGEWWLEYYRYWSEADLGALAAGRGRPLTVPVDFVGRRELMRDTDRAHCRLTAVRGDLGVMRTKKPPPPPAAGRPGSSSRPAFCRFIFDSHTGEALTNQPVSDFVSG
ncbi:hypothetical protein HXX76_013661 [Chlamydomonas incerta]|uniref:BRCT domain-containing protein n=1 Tax=Chlamydomonas incerta TaxID=51695 RepID=A0A835ST80_CHLIN|nr:hypothetical protein HXX76_013661 [Chlamydomonas incerta]|eukprot:KAG2425451.1 hypothetical protein HXX76_013661 [Chlamydomonas incerta]